jgi:hypothetical protein
MSLITMKFLTIDFIGMDIRFVKFAQVRIMAKGRLAGG